jgi:uncharacterized protein
MDNSLVQSEERTWSMLAHLSALLNLFMPALGGLIGAGVIYLVYKDKSKKVAFHALQSLALQGLIAVVVLLVVGGTWVAGFIVSFATIGIGTIIAVPVMILTFFLGFALTIGGTVYALIAAYKVNQGEDFHYYWLGDWAAKHI